MKRLRPEDGAEKHRRAARYHTGACRRASHLPLCVTLRQEIEAFYKALREKTRALEDASDDLIDMSAEADAVEELLENVLRDLFQDFGRVDREDPSLNLQDTAFPDGLSDILEPKGREQLNTVNSLKERIKKHASHPKVIEGMTKLEQASTALDTALSAEEKAEQQVESAATQEADARQSVREQLNSAHGQLRAFFKSNPTRAEKFFIRESGSTRPTTTAPITTAA